ncbi:heavy metal translocating P-type ATPase [Limnothrix redekei]|uniref:Heavy metal translocating P-type ATPase n=1 Tax=Limnothrix redekei LRLZ20PSL1 TaxID=3112953 RepID=A0ABW7CEH2_9CYAN
MGQTVANDRTWRWERPAAWTHWELIHWQPGRVRVRWWPARSSALAVERLETALAARSDVAAVRVVRAAASVTIVYHDRQLPMAGLRLRLDDWLALAWPDRALLLQPVPDLSAPASVGAPTETAEDEDEEEASLPQTLIALTLAGLARWRPLLPLRVLATVALLRAVWPVAQRAWQSVTADRRLNIDCMDLLAIGLSSSGGSLVVPSLVLTLHALGDAIRDRTARATALRTANLSDAIGRFAWVKVNDGPPQRIPSDQLQVGDLVVVYPGEQIPADGPVLSGEATIDEKSLTGEPLPVAASAGRWVHASTLVRSGQIYLRAERVGNQTRAAASLALLEQAPVYDTRMANYAERLADKAIGPALILALVVLIATRDPARAAAILTLDFVTGIRLSIPTAFLGALNHTTRHGVLVRSGRTLEQLAAIDTVVFDKTGTLTQGDIVLEQVLPAQSDITPDQLLQLAASAEQRLTHPVAEAIVRAAADRGLTLSDRGEWNYEVGLGVRAQLAAGDVLVGSARFLIQQGVTGLGEWLTTLDQQASSQPSIAQPSIYVAVDGRFMGELRYTDPLRPESAALVQTLQTELGLDVRLLTGDTPARAAQVARALEIPTDRVYAEAFPDRKATIIRDLRRSGRTVAFVGDGLNDSVALAYADVSISFEQGSEIARETADVVLMNNHLLDLLEVLTIARQTQGLIEQNTALVVLPNLIALGLATTRGLSPPIATAIHNGSAIAAGLNSLRPLIQHHFFERPRDR